ncbi:FecR family protein [Flavobacterium granuli]|uniref:FecR family protein n=1 Tax=Flavobacterium granuli TaxID=280093 RepID=A0A1M5QI74_9FLAO|nr:FecR family protein [Flavobacterium granuli]PRZ20109.1 FecR family protein [Flavobacterium granuli]SHH13616.1 FecR family protein [Flavobacterium granuli]
MPKIQPQIDELITKFLNGTLDNSERTVLEDWVNASDSNKKVFENLSNKEWVATELEKIYGFDEDAGWETIATSLNSKSEGGLIRPYSYWMKWVAAAVVLITLASSGYWFSIFSGSDEALVANLSQEERFGKDIKAPESNKAILTLGDGKKIVLEEVSKGKLATDGDVEVTKTDDGQIIYKGKKETRSNVVNENTLFVPNGSKPVRLVLADGTEVWLNSGSSLTYPSQFVGIDRKVKMTGEVFFDVAKNPAKPFKVMASGLETQALGTQFNINAYADESIAKITLIEGSIKVERKKNKGIADHLIVKPGQQLLGAEALKLIDNANIDEVMAWKKGQFYFEGANIQTIMSQISKYYDIDVVYKGNINYSFVMKISRTVPISELLKIMELTDLVRFKIDGNKITVMEFNKK